MIGAKQAGEHSFEKYNEAILNTPTSPFPSRRILKLMGDNSLQQRSAPTEDEVVLE